VAVLCSVVSPPACLQFFISSLELLFFFFFFFFSKRNFKCYFFKSYFMIGKVREKKINVEKWEGN